MPPAPTTFDDHLAAGETPVTDGSSVLFQETRWSPAAICVTDRRILFVTDDDGFVDVARSQVLSIRSRPTTRRASGEIGAHAILVVGVALATLAVGALLVGTSGATIPLLALLAAAGVLATAVLVALETGLADRGFGSSGLATDPSSRDGEPMARDVGLDADHVATGVDRVDAALAALDGLVADTWIDDALGDVDPFADVGVHRRYEQPVARFVDERPLLRWFAASLGVLGAGGLVVVGAWTALGLAIAVVVGVGIATYGLDRLHDLDDDRRVHRERSVCLYLIGGRTVRFRIDADASIDRELSRLTVGRPALPPAHGAVAPVEERPSERGAPPGP